MTLNKLRDVDFHDCTVEKIILDLAEGIIRLLIEPPYENENAVKKQTLLFLETTNISIKGCLIKDCNHAYGLEIKTDKVDNGYSIEFFIDTDNNLMTLKFDFQTYEILE